MRPKAGTDILWGGGGNDTFVFVACETNNDTILDFAGNGEAAGDQLQFSGYGLAAQGRTCLLVDATHWQINPANGLIHDVITLTNGASIHTNDYLFV